MGNKGALIIREMKGNLYKYLNKWVKLVWGHSLKCDWGKFSKE